MRGTKRFERRITVPYFTVGVLKETSGIGTATVTASSGVPFEYLKIKGATKQELSNYALLYFSEHKNAESYLPAGVNGAYSIALPSELVGKKLTYELKKTDTFRGVLLYLADGDSALFSTLTPLCSSRGEGYTVTGDTFTHLIFTNVYTSDKEDEDGVVSEVRDGIVDFWQSYEINITAEISPDSYTPVLCVGDSGLRTVEIFGGKKKTKTIPKQCTYSGKAIELLLSEYDQIEVYGRQRRVIYKEGSVKFYLNGNEAWQIYSPTALTGEGVFVYCRMTTPFKEGYSPHFNFVPWQPPVSRKNIFTAINASNLAIKLERNTVSNIEYKIALAEVTEFLKSKYLAGEGVVVLAKRASVLEHDLSNTAIGQTLLAVFAPYGTDGELKATGIALMPMLELGYYSLNGGASVTLTLVCQNESSEEISRAEYTLRKGTAYKLSAPEIDGYTPQTSELWGAIKDNKTIIIKYKEKT